MKTSKIDKKLFFFERSFFTLDGLWMIETEKEIDWDTALNIDLVVWQKLLKIIFRRLKSYLKIKTTNLKELIKLLTFRWSVEGWDYESLWKSSNIVEILIKRCPYHVSMDRNPERHNKIPLICKDVCIPLYDSIVNEFNRNIKMKRTNYKGLGDANCNFILHEPLSYSKRQFKERREPKRKINKKAKLFYFEKNFRTLDGLWVIEVENQINFETALKLDVIVWQELYKRIFRRVIKYLKIHSNSLKDLVKILSFIWNCEGNSHEIMVKNENEVIMKIVKCPYIEAMERNPDRYNRVKLICKNMCVPYLEPIIKDFNPKISLKRKHFIGLGDKICDFHFTVL